MATLDLILQNSGDIAKILATSIYAAADLKFKIILHALIKLITIHTMCPSAMIGIPVNYADLIYNNSDYIFTLKSSLPMVNYVTIDIHSFIAIYGTLGDILQNLVLNAGVWVTDGFNIGLGQGDLYVETADVKIKGVISLYNEVGLVKFKDLISNFYSPFALACSKAKAREEWEILEEDTILPRYHMYLDNQRMIQLSSSGVVYWPDAEGWLAEYNFNIVPRELVVQGSIRLLSN